MKTHEPKIDGLKIAKPDLPFAEELKSVAQMIADSTTEAMDSGKMGGVEAAGHISMAMLLAACSKGQIPLKQAYSLLKSIAEKKTPDPVVKIEARTTIDMRAIILEAVGKNATALQDVAAIALATREKVRIKIGAEDNRLELQPVKKTLPDQVAQDQDQADSQVETHQETQPLSELSYDLRKVEFSSLLDREVEQGSGKLEKLLDSEAGGTVYKEAEPDDKDWAPGVEPVEIRELRVLRSEIPGLRKRDVNEQTKS